MTHIEPGEIIRQHSAGDPSRGRIQKMYPRFPPTKREMTGWRYIRRSGECTGHVTPGLPTITGTKHPACLCRSSCGSPTAEYPAMLRADESDLLYEVRLDLRRRPG